MTQLQTQEMDQSALKKAGAVPMAIVLNTYPCLW